MVVAVLGVVLVVVSLIVIVSVLRVTVGTKLHVVMVESLVVAMVGLALGAAHVVLGVVVRRVLCIVSVFRAVCMR